MATWKSVENTALLQRWTTECRDPPHPPTPHQWDGDYAVENRNSIGQTVLITTLGLMVWILLDFQDTF